MSRRSASSGLSMGAIIAVLCMLPIASASCPATDEVDNTDQQLWLYPVSKDGIGTLSTDPAAASDEWHEVAHATGAVPAFMDATLDGAGRQALFTLTELGSDHYLNLTKPITGCLYYGKTPSRDVPDASRDNTYVHVRVEVWAGDARVGAILIQGLEQSEGAVTSPDGRVPWREEPFAFYPEVTALNSSEPITLTVTWYGRTTDFYIKAGGEPRTMLRMDTYPTDPLASGAYVANHQFYPLAPAPDGSEERVAEGYEAWPLGAAGLIGIGLVTQPRRPGGSVRLTTALLVVAVLTMSGCSGKDRESPADVPNGIIPDDDPIITVSNRTDLETKGEGAISGLVRDTIGLLVPRASVALLGTSQSTNTTSDGQFEFSNLVPNNYVLLVGKPGFSSQEIPVQVLAGKEINIVVTLNETGSANTGVHRHEGEWRGETSKMLWKAEDVETGWGAGACTMDFSVSGRKSPCTSTLPLDPTAAIVPPGTRQLDIELTWSGNDPVQLSLAANVPQSTSFRSLYQPPGWTTYGWQSYGARGSGDVFHIPIFPNQADPGHQPFTTWEFQIRLHHPTETQASDYRVSPFAQLPVISYTITAHKGVVPLEPSHPDLWQGHDTIVVYKDEERNAGRANHLTPTPDYPCFEASEGDCRPSDGVWRAGAIIPAETEKLTGWLTWTRSPRGSDLPEPPGQTQWNLVVKPADSPPVLMSDRIEPAVMTKISDTNYSFEYVLKEGEADKPYQKRTYWVFAVDDGEDPISADGPERSSLNSGPETRWTLTVVAHRR